MTLINNQPATSSAQTAASTGPVAFLDLAALHAPIRSELDAVWHSTLQDSAFIGGPAIARFEREWAAYCGTDFCVGLGNGTDSLELTLAALQVGPGDEVLVPANTFVATAEAVVSVGATPVFIDVDPDTLLITPQGMAANITPKTKAVMVVHLYGQIPDMDGIMAVANAADLHVIEDAAQAHGATFNGRRAGSFGVAASFSFYPGKNLGALGDGGAIVTNDEALAGEIRTLSNHGRGSHLLHTHRGRNSRLDGLQASALSIKLAHLDGWNKRRQEMHAIYVERFDRPELRGSLDMLATLPGGSPVHHLEVIRVNDRDRMREALGDAGINTGIHYAMPCHKHPAFAEFDLKPLPVAEAAAVRQLSIPMHPTLTSDEAHRVANTVLELL
ncbi:MAG: DegT/DnrJ/EryC1/StrS family aminotransferase [Acidimicrobiales bacterium]